MLYGRLSEPLFFLEIMIEVYSALRYTVSMIEIQDKTLTDYKYIDLFAGIGGFHLTLSSLGAECVYANE